MAIVVVVVVMLVREVVDGDGELRLRESLRVLKCLGRCGDRSGWCRPRGLCYVLGREWCGKIGRNVEIKC